MKRAFCRLIEHQMHRNKIYNLCAIINGLRWSPAEEQSKFVTFTYIGNTFGTMITYPISGIILGELGWEVSS